MGLFKRIAIKRRNTVISRTLTSGSSIKCLARSGADRWIGLRISFTPRPIALLTPRENRGADA